jgi:hypothetical protein
MSSDQHGLYPQSGCKLGLTGGRRRVKRVVDAGEQKSESHDSLFFSTY